MEELILKVKNKNKIPFIKELLNHLSFVEIVETNPKKSQRKKKKILKDIDESIDFISEYEKGKVKAKSFNQLMNEL